MDEEGSEIRELDRDDRLRILTELRKHPHPLTQQSDSLSDIVNGQVVSETKVNVQDAVEIGQDTITSFASSLPAGFHHPIKKYVETSPEARCEDKGDNYLRLGGSFRTSLAH